MLGIPVAIPLLLALAGVLFCYLLYIRRPPHRPAGERVRQLIEGVLDVSGGEDPLFLLICFRACEANSEDLDRFLTLVRNAVAESKEPAPALPVPLELMTDRPLRGGWVGLHPDAARCHYALALPASHSLLGHTAAVHELFHLFRHVQGVATFEHEAALGFVRGARFRCHEEFVVWRKTWAVAFFGTSLILIGFVAVGVSLGFLIRGIA